MAKTLIDASAGGVTYGTGDYYTRILQDLFLPVVADTVIYPNTRLKRLPRNSTRVQGKNVVFRGETYYWSKHINFLRMIDVPRVSGEPFELAMDPGDDEVRARLASHGWVLVDPRPISADVDAYRAYVEGARGEFTVASDLMKQFAQKRIRFVREGNLPDWERQLFHKLQLHRGGWNLSSMSTGL